LRGTTGPNSAGIKFGKLDSVNTARATGSHQGAWMHSILSTSALANRSRPSIRILEIQALVPSLHKAWAS
jgi:hypothetical protein